MKPPSAPLPRLVDRPLAERLRVMPVVVVTGSRQTGKSTLAQDLAPGNRRYLTLDDLDVAELARRDPGALVGSAHPVTLDEIQRAPDLLLAVKRSVDSDRRAGRFLLTGSANLLLMRRVSESLAGRASYLTLWPMTRREQLGLGRAGLWDELLSADESDWRDVVGGSAEEEDWRRLASRGGYPTPAVELNAARERTIWFDGYVRTYLERDLQDLAAVSALPDFRRLMRAACLRIGQILNQTELGRDVALAQPTVHRWLNLLEASYQLVRLPAYAVNKTKRLIKAPKVYWGDVGLALHLSETSDPGGAHLENVVLQDLLAWRDARLDRAEIFYWRTATGEEVDFVVEAEGSLLPIEVKASAKPGISDAARLRAFKAEYGDRCRSGLLLHTGSVVEWIAPDVLAAPWWRVL